MELKFIQKLMEAIEIGGFRVLTYIDEMLIRLSQGNELHDYSVLLVQGVMALLQIR